MNDAAIATSPVWHPFSPANAELLKVVRGDGVWLELADGRRIIDCISSWWVNLHGHAHPRIAQAISDQAQKLEQVIFAGFTHDPAEEFASRLVLHLPRPLNHVFFSDNGSTAVEVALKMAYQYWQHRGQARHLFVGFDGGYHGDTVGAMSIGGASPFWSGFKKLLFPIEVLPYPESHINDGDFRDVCGEAMLSPGPTEAEVLAALSDLICKRGDEIVGVFIEPLVQGAGGMRMCRPQFIQALRKLTSEAGVLLIFDEVMTGFGRTGDWFAATKCKVTPDLVCLSKGITGGFMPMSVTVATDEIHAAFAVDDWSKMFLHGHSYTANPLACAAANASLSLLEENPAAFMRLESLHLRLAARYLTHPMLEKKRVCGTVFAADIRTSGPNGYFNEIGPALRARFLEQGLLIRPLGNTIYLLPPYCIEADLLEHVYKTIAGVLSDVLA